MAARAQSFLDQKFGENSPGSCRPKASAVLKEGGASRGAWAGTRTLTEPDLPASFAEPNRDFGKQWWEQPESFDPICLLMAQCVFRFESRRWRERKDGTFSAGAPLRQQFRQQIKPCDQQPYLLKKLLEGVGRYLPGETFQRNSQNVIETGPVILSKGTMVECLACRPPNRRPSGTGES